MKAHADGDLAECVLFSLDPVFYGVVIPNGRDKVDIGAMRLIIGRLPQCGAVCLYPEGTRR